MNGSALKELARAIAVVKHDGQCRWNEGEPYINHVDRVADSVNGWRAKTVAYLHDVVEDTDVGIVELKKFFDDEIMIPVFLLTRFSKEITYEEYIQQIALSGNKIAMEVKLADLNDNIRDIDDFPNSKKQKIRYMKAIAAIEEIGV